MSNDPWWGSWGWHFSMCLVLLGIDMAQGQHHRAHTMAMYRLAMEANQ